MNARYESSASIGAERAGKGAEAAIALEVAWAVYGSIEQPTGGYLYDYLIVEQLRQRGASVRIESIDPSDPARVEKLIDRLRSLSELTIVGDALCVPELVEVFACLPRARRVLLAHHFQSWESELDAIERGRVRIAERKAVAASDLVIATSDVTARRVLDQHPGCVTRVVVPGADRLKRLERISNAQVRLLGIGSAIPRKRWDLLLHCLAELRAENLTLRLVGDADRDPTYSAALEWQIGVSPYLRAHVQRLGTVDTHQLANELAHADALVLPSSLEGYGMVLTEALHAGVPVIVSEQAAIPAELQCNDAAILFRNQAELYSALEEFIDNPRKRTLAQIAASRVAAKLPTWSDAGAQFYRLLTNAG